MDRISELPNALLLEILSLLPTYDVVATMVLSKRWKFLWMMVPRLVYDDSYQNIKCERFLRFVNMSLFMHKAPVLEKLHIKLGRNYHHRVEDIQAWIGAAYKFCARQLIVEINNNYYIYNSEDTLPKNLVDTSDEAVETLKLSKEVPLKMSTQASFRFLKTLSLECVKYPSDEFVNRVLSNCHVLEDLVVKRCSDDNVTIFTIRVPSLKTLVMHKMYFDTIVEEVNGHEIVIDAPSLEWLDIINLTGESFVIEHNMPMIVKASFDVSNLVPRNVLGHITSVKYLYICSTTCEDLYPVDSVFQSLVHLRVCTCGSEWLNLLMCLLKDSPKLQSLKLTQCHHQQESRPCWSEPSSVPKCLVSSLETLEWDLYEGAKEEKELVAYILRSGCSLKNLTITSSVSITDDKKFEMLKELSFLSRCSPTCHLTFE